MIQIEVKLISESSGEITVMHDDKRAARFFENEIIHIQRLEGNRIILTVNEEIARERNMV